MKGILDRYLTDGNNYAIKKAAISKSTHELELEIELDFEVPENDIPDLEQGLMSEIPGISGVRFIFIRDGIRKESRGTAAAKNEKKRSVSKPSASAARSRRPVSAGGTGSRATGSKTAGSRAAGGRTSGSGEHQRQVRLLGKAIKGEMTPVSAIKEGDGQIAAEGEVFSISSRTVKNNKEMVSILFSDGRGSMAAKFFVSKEKWKNIGSKLSEGDFVRISGNVEWDRFTDGIVLMAKSMEKTAKPERKDEAPEKRVELHAHTKMSAMDGMNDIRTLVGMAKKWGHKALAITDHGVVQAFPAAYAAAGDDIKIIFGMEGYVFDDSDCITADGEIDYKKKNTNHIIILVRNTTGLRNLYEMVSDSHLKYFYKRPRLPKSLITARREGLIIGSACEAGEVFRAMTEGASEEELEKIAEFYDYLEIQPLDNNRFMIDKEIAADEEELKEFNRRIIALGRRTGKPVAATTDAHYGSPEEAICRQIIMAGQGYSDEGGQGLYMRTTEEMLEEFAYLGEETAREVVIDVPNMIADRIEKIRPVPKGKYPPAIKDADKILRQTCEDRAAAVYGSPLPDPIRKRLDKELDSIIGNGYAVMYVSAQMLVKKSLSDGFLVGSRGSVGSSFAATMAGITEVNPLHPHYICPQCRHLEWGDEQKYDCGVDMPEKMCPECGTLMRQDGFSIPFETFLGFSGNKEPDIDLNFAGEYQTSAQKYVEEIFGAENVYKAGTIGTVKDKTAYGFVMKYFEGKGQPVNRYEADRLARKCCEVKRTTGQHPGGIIIVPEDHEITEFCPVQHPANDRTSDVITTHFDYHSIDENLLKLDILGHDSPSMIRHLQDMTGVDPLKVPLKDEKVNSIFNGIEGLDIKDEDYRFTHGSYGIPEFGTRFVRQMLDDTKPQRFADLVRISGFSHGTNVWVNNAQEFIRNGQATMDNVISTRDDIMNYLILKGVPDSMAFLIMERVRKGKFEGCKEREEMTAAMKENGVPDWYIESCRRISYMFPRAHAVAYVMMSYRIAYYKVYYPAEFYAVYLTAKIDDFNWEIISRGKRAVLQRMDELEIKGKNATAKEQDEVTVLEIVYEMFARGYEFETPGFEHSEAARFTVRDGRVVVPLCGLSGLGETAGKLIEEEYRKRPFATVEEMTDRAKVNKTAIEVMRNFGLLAGMPESDQIDLFSDILKQQST